MPEPRFIPPPPLTGAGRLMKEVREVPPPLPPEEPSFPPVNPLCSAPPNSPLYGNLLVFAKSRVEGYFSGRHRSPYYGSNAEFADYQEYAAGEDIGNVDWRVYGRTRKVFLRKYEEETDMAVYLVVDASGSMQYRGQGSRAEVHPCGQNRGGAGLPDDPPGRQGFALAVRRNAHEIHPARRHAAAPVQPRARTRTCPTQGRDGHRPRAGRMRRASSASAAGS